MGPEARSCFRLIDFYHSTLGLRVTKKEKELKVGVPADSKHEGGMVQAHQTTTGLSTSKVWEAHRMADVMRVWGVIDPTTFPLESVSPCHTHIRA